MYLYMSWLSYARRLGTKVEIRAAVSARCRVVSAFFVFHYSRKKKMQKVPSFIVENALIAVVDLLVEDVSTLIAVACGLWSVV